jgi:hypothetical protein
MTGPGSALARLIARSHLPAEDRCELCDTPLPATHRHLLDVEADTLRCACRPCGLLFERPVAALGRYRLVPQRRRRLPDRTADTEAPVGLAWYVIRPDGSAQVSYPGPAGATTGVVDAATWRALVDCWPELADLAPAVEALLLDRTHGRRHQWIVPIEDCYRLVAVIRTHWRGLSGGRDVWPAVDEFFAGLAGPAHVG